MLVGVGARLHHAAKRSEQQGGRRQALAAVVAANDFLQSFSLAISK
jgi:hypothetical protein